MSRGPSPSRFVLLLGLLGACSITAQPIRFGDAGDDGRGGNGWADVPSKCKGYVGVDAGPGGDLSQGLVAYYPSEQASGTALPDQSGNGRNATLASGGAATGYRFGAGKVGKALYLNSANEGHVVLPAGLLANTCEATITAWVYLNTQAFWQRVWTFSTGGSVYMYLTTANDKTELPRFGITLNANIGDDQQFIDAPTALPTEVWTHLAVVLGPSGVVIYVNGAQVAANPSISLRPPDLGKTTYDYIGRSNYTWDPYLDGNIDDFRVYNRALSREEIQALATAP